MTSLSHIGLIVSDVIGFIWVTKIEEITQALTGDSVLLMKHIFS